MCEIIVDVCIAVLTDPICVDRKACSRIYILLGWATFVIYRVQNRAERSGEGGRVRTVRRKNLRRIKVSLGTKLKVKGLGNGSSMRYFM